MNEIEILNKSKNAIIFCYLCGVKEAYAYNIINNFKEAIDKKVWNKESLNVNSYLTKYSNIHSIFQNLKNNNLILFSKELRDKGRVQRYYKVNIEFFINDKMLEKDEIKNYIQGIHDSFEGFGNKTNKEFFIDIFKRYYFDSPISYLNVISELNKWKKFDFYTVLCFNHTLLTEILIGYNSSSHEEYKNREKMDLKESVLVLLTKYFNLYKNNYFLCCYRDDFENL